MLEELVEFIQSNPDPRELKRAIAVKMWLKGYKQREIQEILFVSSGFISKWTQIYTIEGLSALRLGHKGAIGYLKIEQKKAILKWLSTKNYWNLGELKAYVEAQYEVVFSSQQSYYELFKQAGISWKKTQKCNPKTDPELVKKNDRTDRMARISSGRN
jgi:putative transposase